MAIHKEIYNRGYYANGVYMSVLEEIISAQTQQPDLICYLQPYMEFEISQLRDFTINKGYTWKLYASTTSDLNNIHYVADIVGWENKKSISNERLAFLNSHIQQFQMGEKEIYKEGINLISIKNLKRLLQPIPVSNCIKIEDSTPVIPRSQAGRFSYIYPLEIRETSASLYNNSLLEKELEVTTKESIKDSQEKILSRLTNASRLPEKVQTVSTGFKRNPDVVAYVLKRAKGVCELCNKPAPFIKVSDNTPYLEVHHWTSLAEGGEDTKDNAAALCPNCHKEAHFGINKEKIKLIRTKKG